MQLATLLSSTKEPLSPISLQLVSSICIFTFTALKAWRRVFTATGRTHAELEKIKEGARFAKNSHRRVARLPARLPGFRQDLGQIDLPSGPT